MKKWNWRCNSVSAEDVVTSAKTLDMTPDWYEIDPTIKLTSSAEYLSYARKGLTENNNFGRDAAVCYAKRAVCRDIDAFMACNHLNAFLRREYPEKMAILAEVGVSVPDVVRDLVISPRNDVEHNYVIPEETQARHAVEIAELFINATAKERERRAIISIACSIRVVEQRSCAPGNEYDRIKFTLDRHNKPMLLIDRCSESSLVMVLHPADEEVTYCPLRNFRRSEVIALARLLRQHYALVQGGHWPPRSVDCAWFATLKAQLDLLHIGA